MKRIHTNDIWAIPLREGKMRHHKSLSQPKHERAPVGATKTAQSRVVDAVLGIQPLRVQMEPQQSKTIDFFSHTKRPMSPECISKRMQQVFVFLS